MEKENTVFYLLSALYRKELMMKKQLFILSAILFVCIITVLMINTTVYADAIDNIRVLKISPQDGRAVVKTDERELRIIKEGDVIIVRPVLSSKKQVLSSEKSKESSEFEVRSSRLLVKEIASGRVVFEEQTEAGLETVIVRLEDGKQRIERLRSVPEKKPLLYKPKAVGGKELERQAGSGHGSSVE